MPTREHAKHLARRIHALLGGPQVRRKAAARELARCDPTDATELVDHLLALAHEGWEPASCVLSSVLAALELEAAQIPHARALRRLASLQELQAVALLFADGPAKQEMDPMAAAKEDAKRFSESLGYLKQKARCTTDPDQLARLATASDPSVIRNALLNPRLTEDLVVRIAARRPARPEPLIEVWKSPRWSCRHAVRRALVFNPYLPPEIGAKIVPLLSEVDLRELASDRGLHDSLREQVRVLLARRGARKLSPG